MYSGTTFRTKSGRLMGVHQKIDRIARRALAQQAPAEVEFPTVQEILHFEGLNGPDGIKRKSPAKDEPWHYIDPHNPEDRMLVDMITDHIYNLTQALIEGNRQRAAFEAAWMAHAITDGLTPAHHYPLEEKLEELRGEGIETRISAKEKILLPGKNRRHQIRNNWEFWGAKGVMTTHVAFELGVATTIAGQRMGSVTPSAEDFSRLEKEGYTNLFLESLQKIANLELYEEFSRAGWTRRLARDTRDILIPEIANMVCLAWYDCVRIAAEQKGAKK